MLRHSLQPARSAEANAASLVSFLPNGYSKFLLFTGAKSYQVKSFYQFHCLGGVGERLKPPVLKTGVHFVDREFESRPLRHQLRSDPNVTGVMEYWSYGVLG